MYLYNFAQLSIEKGAQPYMAISENGKTLCATAGKRYWLYDLARKTMIRFHGLDEMITARALSPDGTLAAIGTEKGTIHLQKLETAGLVEIDSPHESAVTALAFSNNGLLSSGSNKGTGIWDLNLPGLIKFIPIEREVVVGLHFDSYKNLIVMTNAQVKRYRSGDFAWETVAVFPNSSGFPWLAISFQPNCLDLKDGLAIGSAAEIKVTLISEKEMGRLYGRYIGTWFGTITAMSFWGNVLAVAHQNFDGYDNSFFLNLADRFISAEGKPALVAKPICFNRRITSLAASPLLPRTLYIALNNGLIQGLNR